MESIKNPMDSSEPEQQLTSEGAPPEGGPAPAVVPQPQAPNSAEKGGAAEGGGPVGGAASTGSGAERGRRRGRWRGRGRGRGRCVINNIRADVDTSTTTSNSAEPVREIKGTLETVLRKGTREEILHVPQDGPRTNNAPAAEVAARAVPAVADDKEDRKILNFIIKNEIYSNYKGLKVWEKMVKEENVERSAKSLCCRFIRIVPNIETYGLPKNIEARIVNGFKGKAGSSTSETESDSELERNEEYEDAVNVDTEKSKSLEEYRRLEHNLQEEAALKLINMKRKWHNEVMNLTDKMRVFCRIRRVLEEEINIYPGLT
ncbi:hypothetical protein CBL_05206 [Carabus blaptoides fortunei]